MSERESGPGRQVRVSLCGVRASPSRVPSPWLQPHSRSALPSTAHHSHSSTLTTASPLDPPPRSHSSTPPPTERNLFTRERNDGLYLVVTYLLSKMVDELLLAGLASLGISAYVFYGIQLQGQWVTFWLIYYIT